MNYKMVGRVLGMVLLCLAGLMLVPLLAGIIYGENVRPFVLCIALNLALGLALASIKPDSTDLFARDGFLAVGLAWMIMSLLGALPYILSGDIPDFVDALFESVSGFSRRSLAPRSASSSRVCARRRRYSTSSTSE